jgi:hypothetical protein
MMTKIKEMKKTIFLGGVSFILTPWSFRFSNINSLPHWKEDFVIYNLQKRKKFKRKKLKKIKIQDG